MTADASVYAAPLLTYIEQLVNLARVELNVRIQPCHQYALVQAIFPKKLKYLIV